MQLKFTRTFKRRSQLGIHGVQLFGKQLDFGDFTGKLPLDVSGMLLKGLQQLDLLFKLSAIGQLLIERLLSVGQLGDQARALLIQLRDFFLLGPGC